MPARPAAVAVVTAGRPALVRRERLVRRLIDSAETSVVLIDAPAGFGKSTVLGEWEAADRRPFAWLTLGDRHDDPVLLTASIAVAVADLTHVDEAVYSALHGSGPGTLKVAIPRLLESLHRSTSPMVLALDDVHALHDSESLGIVAAIADGLPGGSQLALASRSRPSIRLNRLRANRDLTELNAKDLAMTDGEADDLLRACGLQLRTESVELLVARTEGWPAALYLAALSLNSADDADEAAKEFAGDDRMVADYLRDEFISNLREDELAFLTRTSILDRVSSELCDAILETEGSAEMLHRLASSNALVSVDSKGQTFRYHALLREMLNSELHRHYARHEADLHRRASAWYTRCGDFDRAVPHAIASGDIDFAAEMVWSQSAHYASVGREATLQRWLEGFTESQIASSPVLCLVRATCGITAGNGGGATLWTERALSLLEETPPANADVLRIAASAIAATGGARDGVVRMRADAVAAFKLLPDDDPWRSACRMVEGASLHLTGDREGARTALEDGVRRGALGTPSVVAICLAQLALISEEQGDLGEAVRFSKDSLARVEINALADQPTVVLVFAVGAMIATRAGEAAVANLHLKQAARLLGELNEISSWYEVETRIVLARASAALDDISGARAQLADAGRGLRRAPDAPVLREWLEHAWKEADSATVSGRWPLSPAELRLLHHLPTHLTFREIAEESFVSANTVKTQARSIYSKLGVSSRAEAVATARTAGLLDGDPALQSRRD